MVQRRKKIELTNELYSEFSDLIIDWFHKNKRVLPWRETKDPYLIWLSEIILQQTRVEQGTKYFLKFRDSFPTIHHLAKADNDKVMKLWQGLGYYSRAKNLHATAKIISEKHKGIFPSNHSDLLTLKGVGEYTAAAIASFAFNKAHAVVDGNVYRLLSRVFGIKTPIDSSKGKKEFTSLANILIDKKNPGEFNQSIMEFGSIQCKPINPECIVCTLSPKCYAFQNNCVNSLPIKSSKTKTRNRYFNYLVITNGEFILIKKRTEKDIWNNLFDFPLIEMAEPLDETLFLKSQELKKIINKNKFVLKSVSRIYKHVLSHQIIYARFWELEVDVPFIKEIIKSKIVTPSGIVSSFLKIKQKQIHKFAVPRLIEKYLNKS